MTINLNNRRGIPAYYSITAAQTRCWKNTVMQNQTIAIHSAKNSETVVKFVTGIYELLQYCSERQAKRIQHAANNGYLWGAYFTKSGKVRATYI